MGTCTEELARFAAELQYEDIPADVVHQAERLILDTCCCAISGYVLDSGKLYLHVLESLGGAPQATLFPTGHKTSVATAAFVNSQLANLRDLDDNLLYHSHFANTSVMPALAMAEHLRTNGKQFVTAVITAFEVTARISLCMPAFEVTSPPPNIKIEQCEHMSMSYNIFGAAVGCCRLLGLSAQQTANAMGIAGYTAPVPTLTKAMALPRLTMLKYAIYGWQGWGGVVAALLAEQGMTADTGVLDGEHGFWRMTGSEWCDFQILTKGLGSKWWIMDTSIKPYPAGTWMRNPILALDKIIEAHHIKPEEIEQIVAKIWPLWPLHKKGPATQERPESYLDTQISYQYLLAVRALGVPPNRWYSKEVYSDPLVKSMIKKIRIEEDPQSTRALYEEIREGREVRHPSKAPATVEVRARGTTFTEHVEYAKGDPFTKETRLSDEEIAEKFRTYTIGLIRSSHVEPAIKALLTISKVSDIGTLIPLLTA